MALFTDSDVNSLVYSDRDLFEHGYIEYTPWYPEGHWTTPNRELHQSVRYFMDGFNGLD